MLKASLCVCLTVPALARAGVVFLGDFNKSLDATFSKKAVKATAYGGAVLTKGKGGYAFTGEAVSEALDLGLSDAKRRAGVQYEAPLADTRTGTLQLWLKTGFDWAMRPAEPDQWEERSFLVIPLAGGGYNRLHLYWTNRGGVGSFVWYIYDGKRQAQVYLRQMNATALGINAAPNVWHYVVATWTPLRVRLFVDGKLVGDQTLKQPLSLRGADGPLQLGAGKMHGIEMAPAQAVIDSVRIADRPLYVGRNKIPVPQSPLGLKEEDEPGKVLAVGGPGTVLTARPRKLYRAVKFSQAPALDGDLSDPVWARAPCATGLAVPTVEFPFVNHQTSIRVGWDERHLFLGITCYESRMASLKADVHGRKNAGTILGDDTVELFLGPWPGRPKEYYQLITNAANAIYDGKGTDAKWNGDWRLSAKKRKDRWTLEMAVPFASLGARAPVHGTIWKWNVARGRQAGGGVDGASSLAEMSSGYHVPDEFDQLLFVDQVADVRGDERRANARYLTATRAAIAAKLAHAKRELTAGERILARTKASGASVAGLRSAVTAASTRLRAGMAGPTSDTETDNTARMAFTAMDDALLAYTRATNKLGFVSAGQLPPDLKVGVTRVGDYWYLANAHAIAVIDAASGVLCGVYDRNRRPLVRWSYELYMLETVKDTVRTDERLDEVTGCRRKALGLELTCRNPHVPGTITKRYGFAAVNGQDRMLCKEFTVTGTPDQKTLLSLVSTTCFHETFRQQAHYHRVKPAGTSGDHRSVFPAAQVKQPTLLHFLFNVGAAANLCAVNPRTHSGIAQYWLKANGKWVVPNGYEVRKSFFTDSGWDLSWFVTFIGKEPQSAELRYHLFTGDRTAFHQEYRDLPERQAVVNAIPVRAPALRRRYDTDLHPMVNPLPGVGAYFSKRLRPGEVAGMYSCGMDTWYGDYAANDDALLHTERNINSKTRPFKKVREDYTRYKKQYPNLHNGWYYSPQTVSRLSRMYKDHPEWILKGKTGREVPGYDPVSVQANFCPAFVDYMVDRIAKQMDYFGMQLAYLDYSITGPLVDWEHGVVRHSDHSYDFLLRVYREVQKRKGIFWLNSQTFDGPFDFGYYECFTTYGGYGGDWRNASDPLMIRRLYDRPWAPSIPLYWTGGDAFKDRCNYRDYTNLVLSLLFMPAFCVHDPYPVHFKDPATGKTDWAGMWKHTTAYFDTAFEAKGSSWKEIGLSPAWWREPATDIEAYGFQKGAAHLVTVLRHDKKTADVVLSADADKLGLKPDRPTYVWQLWPRDTDTFPRRGGVQPKDWDKLFTRRACTVVPAGQVKGRLAFTATKLQPELTRLFVITQVPAVFAAVEGQATNLLLPETLSSKIVEPFPGKGDGHDLKVTSIYSSDILLHAPGAGVRVSVNGKAVPPVRVTVGDLPLLKVHLDRGESTVSVRRR